MSCLSAVTALVMAIPVSAALADGSGWCVRLVSQTLTRRVSEGGAADPVRHTTQPAGGKVVGKNAAPSFLNDVVPILTRQGCNQGACHGKGAGQNGFRLSLRGYAPESDHRWITREFNGRRIERASPEMSLFLRKPTGDAPHEGGRVFSADSREYRVLLDWLQGRSARAEEGRREAREARAVVRRRRC